MDWLKTIIMTLSTTFGIPPIVIGVVGAMLLGVLTIIAWLKLMTFTEPSMKVPNKVAAPKSLYESRNARR